MRKALDASVCLKIATSEGADPSWRQALVLRPVRSVTGTWSQVHLSANHWDASQLSRKRETSLDGPRSTLPKIGALAVRHTSKQKWAQPDVSSLYASCAHRRERTSARRRPTTVIHLNGGHRCRARRAVASQPRCAPEAAPSHIVAQRHRNAVARPPRAAGSRLHRAVAAGPPTSRHLSSAATADAPRVKTEC